MPTRAPRCARVIVEAALMSVPWAARSPWSALPGRSGFIPAIFSLPTPCLSPVSSRLVHAPGNDLPLPRYPNRMHPAARYTDGPLDARSLAKCLSRVNLAPLKERAAILGPVNVGRLNGIVRRVPTAASLPRITAPAPAGTLACRACRTAVGSQDILAALYPRGRADARGRPSASPEPGIDNHRRAGRDPIDDRPGSTRSIQRRGD